MSPPPEIAPPAIGLLIDAKDQLLIRVNNSLAGIQLRVSGRYIERVGGVKEFSERIGPTSDRAANIFLRAAPEGYLLSIAVSLESGAPVRGQTFCQIGLTRGRVADLFPSALLISDYVEANLHLGWPGGILRSPLDGPGFLRSITGTDPAAGVEISETVPTNARWILRRMVATLVTSATAATRRAVLLFGDGAASFHRCQPEITQTASQTVIYFGARAGNTSAVAAVHSGWHQMTDCPLAPGFTITTSTASLQAGDNYSAPQLLVEEWIQP